MKFKSKSKNGAHRPVDGPTMTMTTTQSELPPPDPATRLDLPTLTGQMSALLTRLRSEYGMTYTSRTWVDVVLSLHAPSAFPYPELARDLLATAALDAGGIRANVSAITASNSGAAIIATGAALRDALESLLVGCERSTAAMPRSSDPTGWPAEFG